MGTAAFTLGRGRWEYPIRQWSPRDSQMVSQLVLAKPKDGSLAPSLLTPRGATQVPREPGGSG